MICEAKDLRKNLKVALTQLLAELPEGKVIHSTKEGKPKLLALLGVNDENHWGIYDRGVSLFTNNLSSVIYELKKKGLITIPKPLHWSRPAVQESLFEIQEEKTIEPSIVEPAILEEKKEKPLLIEDDGYLSKEERLLAHQVKIKGDAILTQAIKDMGGLYGEGGCYGGYGKLPIAICDGGVYKDKVLKPCALRSFCMKFQK